jgi:Ca2+/Na+ antiporter
MRRNHGAVGAMIGTIFFILCLALGFAFGLALSTFADRYNRKRRRLFTQKELNDIVANAVRKYK